MWYAFLHYNTATSLQSHGVQCGGVKENGPQRLIGRGTISRYGLVEVDVLICWRKFSWLTFCCLLNWMKNFQPPPQYHVCLHTHCHASLHDYNGLNLWKCKPNQNTVFLYNSSHGHGVSSSLPIRFYAHLKNYTRLICAVQVLLDLWSSPGDVYTYQGLYS